MPSRLLLLNQPLLRPSSPVLLRPLRRQRLLQSVRTARKLQVRRWEWTWRRSRTSSKSAYCASPTRKSTGTKALASFFRSTSVSSRNSGSFRRGSWVCYPRAERPARPMLKRRTRRVKQLGASRRAETDRRTRWSRSAMQTPMPYSPALATHSSLSPRPSLPARPNSSRPARTLRTSQTSVYRLTCSAVRSTLQPHKPGLYEHLLLRKISRPTQLFASATIAEENGGTSVSPSPSTSIRPPSTRTASPPLSCTQNRPVLRTRPAYVSRALLSQAAARAPFGPPTLSCRRAKKTCPSSPNSPATS
ncbi:hypothetical protein BJY59DRAFT_705462 [Rhodotorula toruloides]